MTQKDLSLACGVTQQMISKIEKGNADSTGDIVAIATALGVTAEWLLTGRDSHQVSPPAETSQVAIPDGARVVAWETLEDLPDRAAYVVVPHFDLHLSAGGGCDWVEHPDNEPMVFRARWFAARGARPELCRALYVRGVSMEPTLQDGDTVLIDTARTEIRDDAIYAVLYHSELYVKRLFLVPGGGVELRSDNPRHPTRVVSGADLEALTVLGLMIWRAG